MSLDAFFDALGPMLRGQHTAADVEQLLGEPSPSGRENLAFYATLVERNCFKILFDVYGPLRALMIRELPDTWAPLVRAYIAAHPPDHWDPNRFAQHFADFLQEERQRNRWASPVYEELADLIYTRQRADTQAADGDGFDQRLFVRQYRYPVPAFLRALARDPATPIPAPKPQVVLIYRHVVDQTLRHAFATAAELAAVARRQGLAELPAMFRDLPPADVDRAETVLVKSGVLTAPSGS